MSILLVQDSFSLLVVCGVAVISFGLGLLFKSAVVTKQRKRILRLEDEMLSNHAQILALEKKIAEGRKETNGVQHDYDLSSRKSDRELKVS